LTSEDRLLWICLYRLWPDWRSALAIVKPETVVAWHRAGFRLFWTWKVWRGQSGRRVISLEVRDLIRHAQQLLPIDIREGVHADTLSPPGAAEREQASEPKAPIIPKQVVQF